MTTGTHVSRRPGTATIPDSLSPLTSPSLSAAPLASRPEEQSAAAASEKPEVAAAGVLDIANDRQEAGFLRAEGCLASSGDVRVPAALIREAGLRKGDFVAGSCTRPRLLARIESVNGHRPEAVRGRPHFRDLTPLHPRHRMRLESATGALAPRIVDLIAPVGKGQRGLIVAPRRRARRCCCNNSPPPSPRITPHPV